MSKPPNLVTLPDDIVCLIFDSLASMQDVLSLAQSRHRFTPIYLRYRQRFRRLQLERVCDLIHEYLEWLADYCQVANERPIVLFPNDTDTWTQDKEPFTLEVLHRLPYLIGDLDDIKSRTGATPHHWRRDPDDPDDGDLKDTYQTARGREMYQAYRYGLDHRGVIAITAKAELMLQPLTSKMCLIGILTQEYGTIDLEEYVHKFSCIQQDADGIVVDDEPIAIPEIRF